MKVIKFLFACLIYILPNCVFAQKTSEITINLKNYDDNLLYLCYTYGNQVFIADSTINKRNKFIFNPETKLSSGMYHIVSQDKNKLFDILIDDDYNYFEIDADNKNLFPSLKAKRSQINSDYFDYLRFINIKQNEIFPFIQQLEETNPQSNVYEQIKKEVNLINTQVYDYIESLRAHNRNNILGLILTTNLPVDLTKGSDFLSNEEKNYLNYLDNYFQNFKVDDARLLRTPIFQEKVNEYLDEVVVQSPKYINMSIDKLLGQCLNSGEVFKYLLWYVTAKYEELITSYAFYETVFVHIIDKYYITGIDTWTSKDIVEALINRANEMRATLIGETVPEMELLDQNNKYTSLYSIEAHYTLIYFWTDDCSNCKKVTEELLNNYSRLNNEYGLEVFGVYIGNTFREMLDYINSNNIPWNNSYIYSSQNIDYTYLYNVHSVPYLLLLDNNKKVIAKRIRVFDLESVINNSENNF